MQARYPSRDELYSKAAALQEMAADKIDELVDALGVGLSKSSKMWIGSCPVHGGDRRDALRLYRDGYSVKGNWVCYTRHCENQFQKSLIGFTRGVLSHQKFGWSGQADQKISFRDTLNYLCSFLGIKLWEVKSEPDAQEKRRFAARMRSMQKSPTTSSSICLSREIVRKHLDLPAQYFLDRGYSAEVLNRFDVGTYKHAGRELSDRAIAPVYDDEGRFVIGFTGRTILGRSPKWLNSPKDFNVHSGLYNFWTARPLIRDTGTIFLVEGQGEVWRMVEAGEERVVGLYGCKLTDEQQVLLERSGAMNVVAILNNDEAGEAGREDIQKRLCRSYRVAIPKPPTNDLGDMSVNEVRSFLSSIRS